MNKEEIVKSLNKVYENSSDSHNIYTPLELCEEMINSLTDLNGDILVISNLEFLIVLKNKIKLDNVHYSTSCDIKKTVAITLGISINNIHFLEYNNKEINLGIEKNMKFDIIIQNPPYNPNSLWKKFVLKAIDLLNDSGKMVIIHPESWRTSGQNKKFCDLLKQHISELHITGFSSFIGIGASTDWYLFNKQKQKQNNCSIYYENGDFEIIKFDKNEILSFSRNSIPGKIIQKICTKENNGLIQQGRTGYHPLYKKHELKNGIYKQCGTEGRGTNWTTGDFSYTIEQNENQFLDKVVMAYTRRPRAKYFSKEDGIGAVRVDFWLTNNKCLPILLNSKMVWKLGIELTPQDPNTKTKGVWGFPYWFLKSLNFDNLNVQTEEQLYTHYNLTQEEINWIEND